MDEQTTSQKLSSNAKTMPRDAKGHFIKKGTDPAATVATEVTTDSPLLVKGDISPDKPLVQMTIQNPFKKLLKWLDDIKKHQTATFDFKISIPLITLPIFLVVLGAAFQYVFHLGQQSQVGVTVSPTPLPSKAPEIVRVSKVGVIKATYAVLGETDANDTTPLPSATPVPPTDTPTPTSPPPTRFGLLDNDGKFFFLQTTVDLNPYLNKRVLVTGMYDMAKETIAIKAAQDIEILP